MVRFRGEYLLLLTVETLEGLSSIYLAHSTNGHNFFVEPKPFMTASEHGTFIDDIKFVNSCIFYPSAPSAISSSQ